MGNSENSDNNQVINRDLDHGRIQIKMPFEIYN